MLSSSWPRQLSASVALFEDSSSLLLVAPTAARTSETYKILQIFNNLNL